MDTDDVVEVYVGSASHDAPRNPRLCGFTRVHVPAGGTASAEIALDPYVFTVIDNDGKRVSGGDAFTLYVGTQQPDARSCELTGASCTEIAVQIG